MALPCYTHRGAEKPGSPPLLTVAPQDVFSLSRSSNREVRISWYLISFRMSILVGEPSPKKGKRALLGDLVIVRGEHTTSQQVEV